jgi:small multidrug resistance pump
VNLHVHYLYLAGAIVLEVIGTYFLERSIGFTQLVPSLITTVTYVGGFYLLALVVKTMPVSIAYAIWSGVGIVLITAVSWVFLKQALDAPALIGMALIVAGVIIINTMSRSIEL